MNDDKRKGMAIMALAANFGKDMPEALITLWLDLLAPYPATLVEEAVKSVVLHYEYKTLPPFAVLQKALDKLCGTDARTMDRQATAEWAGLLDAIRKHGSHNPPDTLHRTTAFVLKIMGGWQAACSWTEQSLEFKRRDFITHWTECHGNVDAMALGAAGLLPTIKVGNGRPLHVGGGLRGLLEGGNHGEF